MKHQHYTPSAEVVVLDDATAITDAALAAYIGVSSRSEPFRKVMVCADVADYARNLFEFFRECDRLAIKRIHCERVESKGIGSALMDRIDRAARR